MNWQEMQKSWAQLSVLVQAQWPRLTRADLHDINGDRPALAEALGASQSSFYLDILVFGMLYSPLSEALGILMKMRHRWRKDWQQWMH